jgi:hypothetical protein
VNETLRDLRALAPLRQAVVGAAALRPVWFSQMRQLAVVGTITGRSVDVTTAQYAAVRSRPPHRAMCAPASMAGDAFMLVPPHIPPLRVAGEPTRAESPANAV